MPEEIKTVEAEEIIAKPEIKQVENLIYLSESDRIKKAKKRKTYFCKACNHQSTDNTPLTCPKCGTKYWNKPIDEYKLFLCQEEWEKTHNNTALEDMYKALEVYVRKSINKTIGKNYRLRKDILQEKAHDVCSKLIEKYLNNESFHIDASFYGYFSWLILESLYENKEDERNLSLNSEDESENEFISNIQCDKADNHFHKKFEEINGETSNNLDMLEEIERVLDVCFEYVSKIHNYEKAILFSLGIRLRLLQKNKKRRMDIFYKYWGMDMKSMIENCYNQIYQVANVYQEETEESIESHYKIERLNKPFTGKEDYIVDTDIEETLDLLMDNVYASAGKNK